MLLVGKAFLKIRERNVTWSCGPSYLNLHYVLNKHNTSLMTLWLLKSTIFYLPNIQILTTRWCFYWMCRKVFGDQIKFLLYFSKLYMLSVHHRVILRGYGQFLEFKHCTFLDCTFLDFRDWWATFLFCLTHSRFYVNNLR